MNNKLALGILTLSGILLWWPAGIALGDSSDVVLGKPASDIETVKTGEAVRCKKNFIAENNDQEPADLKVVLGNKVFVDEIVAPGEKRAFSLAGSIYVAQHHGQDVTFDTEAIIINLGPGTLQTRCIQLPPHPLRKEDELATFK